MSANHRPAAKPGQRPLRKPAHVLAAAASQQLPPAAEPVSVPSALPEPAPAQDTADCLEPHFSRLSALLTKAERIAETLLDTLLAKAQRREQVYPGELIHICRGLHVLAKCGAELARATRQGASAAALRTAQVEKLEARLKQQFAL